MYISAVNFPLVFMFSVRRQMSPVCARRVAFVFRDFPIGFIQIISNDFTLSHYVRWMHNEILCLLHFCRPGFSDDSYSTMEFNGLTSASHMSLPEAGYGSEEDQLGSEISGAVSGVTTPGASRLQASQLQEGSATMQRLHGSRGNHDSASGISTDTLRSSDFSGAITRSGSLRVPPEVTFVASPQSVLTVAIDIGLEFILVLIVV